MIFLTLIKEDVVESNVVAVEDRAMFDMLDVASVALEVALVAL